MTNQKIKYLQLKLKKDVLIVDIPELTDYEVFKHGIYFQFENNLRDFIEGNFTLLCKGKELTEEECEELVENSKDIDWFYKNYSNTNCSLFFAKQSFLSAISAQNHHWLVNPESKFHFNPEEFIQEEYERFMEAESRTLKNPLIFIKN